MWGLLELIALLGKWVCIIGILPALINGGFLTAFGLFTLAAILNGTAKGIHFRRMDL